MYFYLKSMLKSVQQILFIYIIIEIIKKYYIIDYAFY